MIYPLLEIDFKEILSYNWNAIIIGTVVSGIVGYLCIKYFMKFLSKFSLAVLLFINGYFCICIFYNVLKFVVCSKGLLGTEN